MPGLLKLLGCDVLVSPLPDEQKSHEGVIVIVNHYKRPVMRFRVVAVGPGKFVPISKKKRTFVEPEVKPGDIIITRFLVDSSLSQERLPWYRQPYHLEDGTTRVIIDCRDIIAKEEGWESSSVQTNYHSAVAV